MRSSICRGTVAALLLLAFGSPILAQKPPDPEVGYVYPPGVPRGQTVAVQLAGFDWTPDLQFFVLDSRIGLQIEGPLSRHLMPEPPYPVGMKAYRPPPIPREITARLTIPADFPPGPVRWQVANANGASQTGIFFVGEGPEVVESRVGQADQSVGPLPLTISGRLGRFEEVDAFRITTERDEIVTCDLIARRLGSNFHGVVEVRDAAGHLIADAADTEGRDVTVSFPARARESYRVTVRDLNFRGNRAFVYRLAFTSGPRILAAIPAAGRRGTTANVELIGYGLSTGRCELERVIRPVNFPALPAKHDFEYRLELSAGRNATFRLPVSEIPELVEPESPALPPPLLEVPSAITGRLDRSKRTDRYRIAGRQGERWNIAADARSLGSPLDVVVAILAPDGKELAGNDDLPGTTDAGLELTLPHDGIYELLVSDSSGTEPSPLALYRLAIRPALPDFQMEVSQHVNVPVGDKVDLPIKVVRTGGFTGPIALSVAGLPEGVSVPADLTIAADQSDYKLPLQSASDAPSGAAMITISGEATINGQLQRRRAFAPAAGSLASRLPSEPSVDSILVASTLKPVARIRPLETDERTAHRGTMHLAELEIERLNDFHGDVVVQMDSRQPVKFRQGVIGPDIVVPATADRVFYPCLVPDVAETVDAYRMLLVAVAQVPDSKGRVRYVLSKMKADDASVAVTVEGALLKIASNPGSIPVGPGETASIPLRVARSAKLSGLVRLEVRLPGDLQDALSVEPLDVAPGQSRVALPIRLAENSKLHGRYSLTVRAVVVQPADLPQLAESAGATPLDSELLKILRTGSVPILAETSVNLELNTTATK